jgi:hypothetical protein
MGRAAGDLKLIASRIRAIALSIGGAFADRGTSGEEETS